MIKLFVSDLDGTLLSRNIDIEMDNKLAIIRAMEQDIHIAIASGRMSSEIRSLMADFPQGSYAIGQNGATVYSKEHQLLQADQHLPEHAHLLFQLGMQMKELVIFVNSIYDDSFVIERNERTKQYEPRIIAAIKELPNIEEQLSSGALHCSKVTFLGDMKLIEQLKAQLHEQLGDSVEIAISDFDCMDVTPKGVSKGKAVQLLMEQLKLEAHEVACIGDSYNDLSMFKVAGHSFAMRHSDEPILEQANYIVDSVAEAIDYCLQQINSK